jgi:hypothetical protein
MHTYKKVKNENLWTVGYHTIGPNAQHNWNPLRDFGSEMEAASYANYLNGGGGHIPNTSWSK